MSKAPSKKPPKCGLIMPISSIDGCDESHWEAVRNIVEEALEDTDLKVELVSDADEVGVIQKRIIQNIYDNDIVVCDVSCKNPNVMFELGMRLAFDKPAVIIKDDVTSYSFDTSPVEHLGYPRGLNYHQIQDFKLKLKSKVISTIEAATKPDYTTFLKHFGKFVVASLDEKEIGKDDYILESLKELKRDVSRMRMEHNEVIHGRFDSPRGRHRIRNAHDFAMNYCERNPLTQKDLNSLKDSESDLFQRLHSEYVDTVVSRAVNPKPRHEEMAKKELLSAFCDILP